MDSLTLLTRKAPAGKMLQACCVLIVFILGLPVIVYVAGALWLEKPFTRRARPWLLVHVAVVTLCVLVGVGVKSEKLLTVVLAAGPLTALWLLILAALVWHRLSTGHICPICGRVCSEGDAWRRCGYCEWTVCHTCGYDLTGNVSGICPECGHPVPRRGGADTGQGFRRNDSSAEH